MKGRTIRNLKTVSIEEVRIVGEFAPQGASAPTVSFPTKHPRFTVVRTSTGLYTVTLIDKFYEWRVASLRSSLSAATTRVLQLNAMNMAAGTFAIANVDAAATVQDIPANALNTIFFEIAGMTSGV